MSFLFFIIFSLLYSIASNFLRDILIIFVISKYKLANLLIAFNKYHYDSNFWIVNEWI